MDEIASCDSCGVRVKRKPGAKQTRWLCPKCGATNPRPKEPSPTAGDLTTAARPRTESPPSDPSATNDPAALLRTLFASFRGEVPRRLPSTAYRVALLATALGVVVLMLLYAATIAAGAYGLYLYATKLVPVSLSLPGRAKAMMLAVHTAALLSGAGLLISAVVPIFVRRRFRDPGILLPPSEATVLYSFVARIAEVLGAPPPREIRLSIYANASASYRGGLAGLAKGDLILTLGAPLIAGLSMRQLAGIVAHELGHFSQRGGMLVRHFVSTFTTWCGEAISLQSELAHTVTESEPDDSPLVLLLRGVWSLVQMLGTAVVWLFAMSGLFLTRFVSRQQEYDADRYEMDLTGSDHFTTTTRRLIELNLGQQQILKRGLSNLISVLSDEEGVGHFAAEVVAAADIAREKSGKQIERELNRATGWFDTHPGNRARLAAAALRPCPGLFDSRLPAYALYPSLNPNPEYAPETPLPTDW